MRLLITGITGFVGSHMAEYALAQGAAVSGSVRWRSRTENIEHLRGQIRLIECDLRDSASVRRLLAASAPTHIIHLAAQSYVAASWHTPGETLSTNITGQVNLLEGIREIPTPPRVLIIGSSEEYGLVHPDELPIRETNPLRPLSPYAVSKVGQDLMGFQYFRSYGLPILRTRAFNHEGPRRGEVFVTSNFAKQVAEIEAGRHDPVIDVGDLTPRRDYSDVRDIVRGYWMLLERGEPGRGLQSLLGADLDDPAGARVLPRPLAHAGDLRPGRPGAAASVGRDGAGRGPVEDPQGARVADRDPLRADAHGPPRVLATARRVDPSLTRDCAGDRARIVILG